MFYTAAFAIIASTEVDIEGTGEERILPYIQMTISSCSNLMALICLQWLRSPLLLEIVSAALVVWYFVFVTFYIIFGGTAN